MRKMGLRAAGVTVTAILGVLAISAPHASAAEPTSTVIAAVDRCIII